MNDKEIFRNWLCNDIGLQSRSAKDVLSRLTRAHKYVNVVDKVSDDELIFRMAQNQEFKDIPRTVQSQLKRAVKLYRVFLRIN